MNNTYYTTMLLVIIQTLKLLIFYLTVTSGKYLSKTSRPIYNESINILQTIWNVCFNNEFEEVLLFGDWNKSNFNFPKFYTKSQGVFILGDRSSKYNISKVYDAKGKIYKLDPSGILFKPIPAKTFVIVHSKPSLFNFTLHKLRRSIYWNAYGFFIIENSEMLGSCKYAYKILSTTWAYDVLRAILVCRDESYRISFYTFNPFNDQAPYPWTIDRKYLQSNGHPFFLFYYFPDKIDCKYEYLNFDKSLSLSGYPTNLVAINDSFTFIPGTDKESFRKIRGVVGVAVQLIWLKLNANVMLDLVNYSQMGVIEENGKANGVLGQILTGKYDSIMNNNYRKDIWRNELNTLMLSQICYVTNKIPIVVSHNILKLLPDLVWKMLITFYVCMAIFLAFLTKSKLSTIAFDILRAISGGPMIRQPNFDLPRLVFIILVCVFMVVNSFLQSKLNSMLSVSPVKIYNVQSSEDVFNLSLRAYGKYTLIPYFANTLLRNNIEKVNNFPECLGILQRDSKALCIEDCIITNALVKESNHLHISVDDYLNKYYVYAFRDDYPLRNRVRVIYYRLYESGIPHFLLSIHPKVKLNKDQEDSAKTITLNQIRFAFYYLIICFLCSISALIIEILIRIIKKEIPNFSSSVANRNRSALILAWR